MYKVTVENKTYEFKEKKTLLEIRELVNAKGFVATVNNCLRELGYYVNYDCQVAFLGFENYDAIRVYETSLRFVLTMAIYNLYPKATVRFNQCISRSLACQVDGVGVIDQIFLNNLNQELQRIIKADYPIHRLKKTKEEAIEFYKKLGASDKLDVLKYQNSSDSVTMYECNGFINYMFGYMIAKTGDLVDYQLMLFHPNFLVRYPRSEENGKIPMVFDNAPALGQMIDDAKDWSRMIGANTIPEINRHIKKDGGIDLINICETKHNNQFAELGNIIKDNINRVRLIAIAGPSSSGKTTFSNRLRIELLSKGIKPVKVSIDDYYLDRELAPKDELGEPDLEHVNALDIKLFNEHLLALIQGKEVEMPRFDFKIGKRVKGHKVRVHNNEPIIIEGIHALNESLTASIPKHQKFRIYISPLAQINIDGQTPISATDIRLLRRIVRDNAFRKTSIEETFDMWPNVRKGEFRWIYPYQETADFVFNTELTYELAVMKRYAYPLLTAISSESKYYVMASRLLKFLRYFLDIDPKLVPINSLLKEFIGGSCFEDK